MKRFIIPRAFWPQVILFGAASLILLLVIGGLFESASGSDFEPAQAGSLFATYHALLAALLGVLSVPALIIYPILTHLGVNPNWGDSFYVGVICLIDGLVVATIFRAIHRYRSRRPVSHDAQPTI